MMDLLWIFNKTIKIAFESYDIWNVCLATVVQVSRVRYIIRLKLQFHLLHVLHRQLAKNYKS